MYVSSDKIPVFPGTQIIINVSFITIIQIFVQTRTQIVDEVDSSVVTLHLDVHPGFTVVETGTGSGCMTMSLARAVHPSGHVFTFEYNGVRAQKAREEFNK